MVGTLPMTAFAKTEASSTYTVTLPTGEGYTVEPVAGSVSPVAEGESFSFTVTIEDGYHRGMDFDVYANSTVLYQDYDGVYTIYNITSDQTVSVEDVFKVNYNENDVFFHEESGFWFEMLHKGQDSSYGVLAIAAPPEGAAPYSRSSYTVPYLVELDGVNNVVTGVNSYAFYGNTSVESISLIDGRISYIGPSAFQNCTKLRSITLPGNYESINAHAFAGCTELQHITIPTDTGNIGAYAFQGCTALETVVYDYPYSKQRTVDETAFEDSSPIIINQYIAPGNPRWEGTTATWDPIGTSYVRYEVQFSGTASNGLAWRTESFYTTGNTMELSEYSTAPGVYSFTVKAVEPETVFHDLKVDVSASVQGPSLTVDGAELTAVQAVRTAPGTVSLTFHSNAPGELYYLATQQESIDGPGTDGAGIICTQGSNTVTLTGIPDEELYLELRLKNNSGMRSELIRLKLPAVSNTVTVTYDTNGGTASAFPTTAAPGMKITLTAVPDNGWFFKEWVVLSGGVTISGNEFTMPDSDVTVKAVFEEALPLQIYIMLKSGEYVPLDMELADSIENVKQRIQEETGISSEKQILVFDGKTLEHGRTLADYNIKNGDVLYLSLTADSFLITVSASPTEGGSVTGGNAYEEETAVTVAAVANSGYQFVRWTENGTEVSANARYTFNATEDRSLVAVFKKVEQPSSPAAYTGTATTGANGSITPTSVNDAPPTGDNSRLSLWIGLLMLSAAGIVGGVIISRRKLHK